MPDNFNDEVQDRVINHMLMLEGLKNRQQREAIEFLDGEVIPDLITQLTVRLGRIEKFGFDRGPETTKRIESMIEELSAITGRFKDFNTRTQGELFELASDEADWQNNVLNETAGVNLNLATVAPAQLKTVLFTKPFDGRTLEQWYDKLSESAQSRLSQEIRRGVTEGQTTAQIVRNVEKGGFLDITRSQTKAVVRTATAHASNSAREAFFNENSDVIEGLQWVATLDSRTCLSCAPLDGRIFPLDKGPRCPLHTNCRCTMTPIMKSFRSFGIAADELPEGTRASMNGQVPRSLTYNAWLKRQSFETQTLALGKSRAKLFRDGNLTVDQFVSNNRVEFTLDDLRKREAQAFKKAGLQ